MNRFYTKALCTVLFFSIIQAVAAQDTILNKYNLWVINDITGYRKSIRNKPAFALTEVKKLIPGIEIDLRYAGAANFTHKKLYQPTSMAYLRRGTATALASVQRELNDKDMGLKLFDAYRPYAITEIMWELVKDDRYAADPKKGSSHNRGVAVDLTVINLKTGKELDMGTGFDNFSDTAHHAFTKLPEAILQNRLLLKTTMEKYGFTPLDTEWWHYSLPEAKNYPLLNLDFDLLKKYRKFFN